MIVLNGGRFIKTGPHEHEVADSWAFCPIATAHGTRANQWNVQIFYKG
jgi:hypothetical protein